MKRLTQAPNLAIATLWCDQLCSAGLKASVQRAYASGIAGHIPPDQALPEIWIEADDQLAEARRLLELWRHPPERRWACTGCEEIVEGPFEQCWNCGTLQADASR